MKRTPILLTAGALAALMTAGLLTGCGGSGKNGSSGDDNKLYVYNWGEYIDPEVLTMFEEETGIHVVYEEFETKEQAMKREYAIKQLGRKEKQKLIAGKKVKLSDERKEKED